MLSASLWLSGLLGLSGFFRVFRVSKVIRVILLFLGVLGLILWFFALLLFYPSCDYTYFNAARLVRVELLELLVC
jgi:hypothetical protein